MARQGLNSVDLNPGGPQELYSAPPERVTAPAWCPGWVPNREAKLPAPLE